MRGSEPKGVLALANDVEQPVRPASTDKISAIRIDDCEGNKANPQQYIESKLEHLVSQNPRFMTVKSSLDLYLSELEGFLHIQLMLHQLKHISSYSTPDFILGQLPSVGKTMRAAILKTLEKPPF
jgi:hypothetical protein